MGRSGERSGERSGPGGREWAGGEGVGRGGEGVGRGEGSGERSGPGGKEWAGGEGVGRGERSGPGRIGLLYVIYPYFKIFYSIFLKSPFRRQKPST